MTRPIDIQVLSDLHLETPLIRPSYEHFEIPVCAPNLALLGDIGKTNQPELFQFLRRQVQRYDIVFYLLGNHEAYRCEEEYASYARARELVRDFEASINREKINESDKSTGQFVFLDRTRFDIPNSNVTILGCTLFSYIPSEQVRSVLLKVNDFSAFGPGSGRIDDWTPASHNSAHLKDLAWLNETVTQIEQADAHREIAIFTHHSPTLLPKANDPEHLEDERNINSAFVTDLSEEICWNSTLVKTWAFGHTHFNCDFVEDTPNRAEGSSSKQMRIVTNQRGYFRSEVAPGFEETKIVTLGRKC